MQFEGRVKEVMPVQEGVSQRTGEPWKSQQFIFGYYESPDAMYEREVILKLRNDKVDQYKLQQGDQIKARFATGVNTYEGKKYNDIYTGEIVVIKRAEQPVAAPTEAPGPAAPAAEQEQPLKDANGNDLPF